MPLHDKFPKSWLDENSENAKIILEALQKMFDRLGNEINLAKNGLNVNTASGFYLDLQGADYNVVRATGESDESYRFRIQDEMLRQKNTVGSIIAAMENIGSKKTTIYEPWRNLFRVDRSQLSGSDKIIDYEFWDYHVIEILSAVKPDLVERTLSKIVAAGKTTYITTLLEQYESISLSSEEQSRVSFDAYIDDFYETLKLTDGIPTNASLTISRSSPAFFGDGLQVDTNLPRLIPSLKKFGYKMLIEHGTSNIFVNPGWLTGDLTNWNAYTSDVTPGERAVEPDDIYGYHLRLKKIDTQSTTTRWGVSKNQTWAVGGSPITITVRFKILSAEPNSKLRLYTDFNNTVGTLYAGRGWYIDLNTLELTPAKLDTPGVYEVTAKTDGWYEVVWTTAEIDNKLGSMYFWLEGAPCEVLLAWSQLEALAYGTTFCNPARSHEVISFSTTDLSIDRGFVIDADIWITPSSIRQQSSTWPSVFFIRRGIGSGTFLWLYHGSVGSPGWYIQTRNDVDAASISGMISDTLTPVNKMARFTIMVSRTRIDVYVNNNPTPAATILNPLWGTTGIGSGYLLSNSGASNFLNAYLGGFRITQGTTVTFTDLNKPLVPISAPMTTDINLLIDWKSRRKKYLDWSPAMAAFSSYNFADLVEIPYLQMGWKIKNEVKGVDY